MSGGSVFNSNNELVGIIYGLNMKNGHTMIVPVQSFMDVLPIKIKDEILAKNKVDYSAK